MGFGNYEICDLWDFGIMGEGGRRGAKQREKGRARALVHQFGTIPKKINQKFSTQLLSNVKLKQHVKDQSKAKLIKQHQLRILSSKNI